MWNMFKLYLGLFYDPIKVTAIIMKMKRGPLDYAGEPALKRVGGDHTCDLPSPFHWSNVLCTKFNLKKYLIHMENLLLT